MNVLEILQSCDIRYQVVDHPPVYTVADVLKHLPGEYPVKNLLLKEEKGDRCVFVIMKGDERLDTKLLAEKVGCKKLQFAKPDILMAKLGVEPGSASLFSLLHEGSGGLDVVVDSRLLVQDHVGFHPSVNTQTITIAGKDIETFLTHISRQYTVAKL